MKKFLSAIGKKNIIIISGIMLIGIAIFFNLTLTPPDDIIPDGAHRVLEYHSPTESIDPRTLGQSALVSANVGAQSEDNFFAVSQMNRQRARDEAIEVLQNIAEASEVMSDVRSEALSDISAIAHEIEMEANIETLIRAKGFEECVAIVSGGNANVIVRSDGLLPNELAIIKEIVFNETNIPPSRVKIIERN